mmetsp:Transcript_52784/g.132778  ORF Transcript_52784/g.132778 Transcript_52784/m.132778 type:complete len:312 (-) Transcript_52784:564-1499(-)
MTVPMCVATNSVLLSSCSCLQKSAIFAHTGLALVAPPSSPKVVMTGPAMCVGAGAGGGPPAGTPGPSNPVDGGCMSILVTRWSSFCGCRAAVAKSAMLMGACPRSSSTYRHAPASRSAPMSPVCSASEHARYASIARSRSTRSTPSDSPTSLMVKYATRKLWSGPIGTPPACPPSDIGSCSACRSAGPYPGVRSCGLTDCGPCSGGGGGDCRPVRSPSAVLSCRMACMSALDSCGSSDSHVGCCWERGDTWSSVWCLIQEPGGVSVWVRVESITRLIHEPSLGSRFITHELLLDDEDMRDRGRLPPTLDCW